MTETEEREIRNHLRQARALLVSFANAGDGHTQCYRSCAGVAHIDQAGDVLDSMRQRENMLRRAWSSLKQRELTEG